MNTTTKKTLLIGTIIILIVINISALATIFYNNKIRPHRSAETNNLTDEARTRGMHRFMREQLNLTDGQYAQFQEINRTNMTKVHNIASELNNKRIEMMNEIAKKNPNLKILDDIAYDIGSLHYELKKVTIHHFLELKEICTPEQQDSLQKIFIRLIQDQDNNEIKKPEHDKQERNRMRGPHRRN